MKKKKKYKIYKPNNPKNHKIKDPIYVPNKELGLTNWLPPAEKECINIESNNWFDIKFFENPDKIESEIYLTEAPIIPPESFKQQMKTINKLKGRNPYLVKEPVFLYCKKIRLYFTKEQEKIIHTWFDLFTEMYNCTVIYLHHKIFNKKKIVDDAKKLVTFEKNRCELKEIRDRIKNSIQIHQMPTHILDEAINLACSNYKSSLENLEQGNIKKFRIRELSYNRRRKILKIEKLFFKGETFCPTIFNFIKASETLTTIERTCTLQFDNDTGKYILLAPSSIPINENVIKQLLDCGGDLGVRSFLTIFSANNVYSFCNNAENDPVIMNYHKKIDNINFLLRLDKEQRKNFKVKKMVKENGEVVIKHVYKKIKRSSLRRGLRKYNRKIRNRIKDMHYKVAHKLVNTFDNIFIGKLSTKSILSKRNKKIPESSKRMLKEFSPYTFWKILEYMAYKYGSKATQVSERLTTVTCSNCGAINYIEGSKVYICQKCGLITGRDENSGKNHLKLGREGKDINKQKLTYKNKPRKPKETNQRKQIKKRTLKRMNSTEIIEV